MKKTMLFIGLLLVVLISASTVFMPQHAASQKTTKTSLSTSIPDDVKKIFENSCTGCHFDGGSAMAMGKVNFSIWDTYPADKQAKKSSAVCDEVTNKSMPPSSVVKANPDKALNQEQIKKVCDWAGSLAIKK
jgi:hypothetical protein